MKLGQSRYILALLIVASQAFASPGSSSTSRGQEGGLFEMKVGLEWRYSVELEGEAPREVTDRIVSSQLAHGNIWYELKEHDERYWIRNSELGQLEAVNAYDDSPQQVDELTEALVFKFPARVGERWDMDGTPVSYQGLKQREVPAGRFRCHQYLLDLGEDGYSIYCIAKNVGVIYLESDIDGRKEISRLTSYSQ